MYKLSIDQEMLRDQMRDMLANKPLTDYQRRIMAEKKARDAAYLEQIKRQIEMEG